MLELLVRMMIINYVEEGMWSWIMKITLQESLTKSKENSSSLSFIIKPAIAVKMTLTAVTFDASLCGQAL